MSNEQDNDEQVSFADASIDRSLVAIDQDLPRQVIALPLSQRPVFPGMLLPMSVPPGPLAEALRIAIEQRQRMAGFFLTTNTMPPDTTWGLDDLHRMGAVVRIEKHQFREDGGAQVFAQVLSRFQIDDVISEQPFLLVSGQPIHNVVDNQDQQVRARAMAVVTALKDLVQYNPVFADEIKMVLANFNQIDGPGRLADLAASLTTAAREEIQEVLETLDIIPRMDKVLLLLAKEAQLAALKTKISEQINDQVNERQRTFFLHEQLKAIKQELGLEKDDKSLELDKLRQQLEEQREQMPEEVLGACQDEIRKLSLLESSSPEYGVARNRVEWLLALPWGTSTTDNLELDRIRRGLDADHYGLEEVKDRIIQFCAVRRLRNDHGGGIIALVGPPGCGKTSIGASIARHLGRRFFRFSLGGLRDEAEIKGHRRTYIGALPGKLAQALRRCGTMNPVILLDEIDKLSHGPQGDPSAALLEVLDPEQNREFLDHYLDVRIDLSQVLFICTANDISTIPEALHDRMEIIRLAGYVEPEKLAIARRYLVPKQRQAHGLSGRDLTIRRPALTALVRSYAREAGVRRAEQHVAKICRQVATAKVTWQQEQPQTPYPGVTITAATLADYLGKPTISDEALMGRAVPGVVTGLAWTAMGGATLEIEAIAIPATEGGFQLSGQLGDVMKESATLARSYLRANAARFGITADWFDSHLIHLHVPAGATPKDGPSAGITMATAMLSLALGRPVRRHLGMTGELTLTGRVYPIGGVREKLVAARRSRLRTVILPQANEADHARLPSHICDGITVHFVETLDQVLAIAGLLEACKG